jgi:hypothetical protein
MKSSYRNGLGYTIMWYGQTLMEWMKINHNDPNANVIYLPFPCIYGVKQEKYGLYLNFSHSFPCYS